jgi:hypothetical protein
MMALEQLLGLVGKKVAHPLRAGPFGVVVMGTVHRLADFLGLLVGLVSGAQRVVEHHDAARAALPLHQFDHLRVIDPLDLLGVEEVFHPGRVIDEAEAVHLQVEFLHLRTGVVHRHVVWIDGALALDLGRTWAAAVGEDLGAVVGDVVYSGFDGARRGVEFGEFGHGVLHAPSI